MSDAASKREGFLSVSVSVCLRVCVSVCGHNVSEREREGACPNVRMHAGVERDQRFIRAGFLGVCMCVCARAHTHTRGMCVDA